MTLEGEEKHEDDASPRSKTSGTDSFLDELEEAGGRLEASLPKGAAGMSAADLIAAAVAGASDDGGFEYMAPPNTVAVVAMGTKASESTKNETAAAAVGGDGAAPESPRGSSSSAMSATAPVPGGKPLVVQAGGVAPPSSGVPPGRGASSSATAGSAVRPALAPSRGSPSTPVSVHPAFTTPPSGALLPPAGVRQSSRDRLAAAVGTGDFELVDPAKLLLVVDSLMEATEDTIARLGQQYDAVSRRALESCDDAEYSQWEARADKLLAQRSLEQGWLSYLRAQRPVVARAGPSASGEPSPKKETASKRQLLRVTKFAEKLYTHVPAFTSEKRVTTATPVAAIEKWVRSICDYLLSSLPALGQLIAEALAAYLSVSWSVPLGGSAEAPVVVGADSALTPMDSRPVGAQLEAILARTTVRRSAGEAFLDWVRRVVRVELVQQAASEYLHEALEALTDRVKAAVDPSVVKEINRGGAAQPVLSETDVFQLLYNLLKDRGRGHLSQAKRILGGLGQPPTMDKLTSRTSWEEVVRQAIDAYSRKLADLSALQGTVSWALLLLDSTLPIFPASAETPSASFFASDRVTALQRWRDRNLQATSRECMARLQEELRGATESAPVIGLVWTNAKSYADAAAAHVDQPRGRSDARTEGPRSRSGTPVGGERRGSASPTRPKCKHTAETCWRLRDRGECWYSGHTTAERDAAWKAVQEWKEPKKAPAAVEAPKQQGGDGSKGGRGGKGGKGGKGGDGKGKGGRVVKVDPEAVVAHGRNKDRRTQVDSDYAAVTPAEAEIAAAISNVFGESEVAATVDLFAVGVGGWVPGHTVPTDPVDETFSDGLAMNMPCMHLLQSTPPVPPPAESPRTATVVASARSQPKSALSRRHACVPWQAARIALVPSVRELERVFDEVFCGVAPYVAAMSPACQRVLLLRGGGWVADMFARAMTAIARGGGTVWQVWEDYMNTMASRSGGPMPVGGECVLVPRSQSNALLSLADREWYAGELCRLAAAIEPVEKELARLPTAVVGGGADASVADEQGAADSVKQLALQAAATCPPKRPVSDTGAGGNFFPMDPNNPDTVPVPPFDVRGATSATCQRFDRGRVKEFCWPTTDGDAITVPFLGSSSRTVQTDLISVGGMINDFQCEYHLSPNPANCYIEFPPEVTGTVKKRVPLEIGPAHNPTVRFPPTLDRKEARVMRPVDADLTELDRLLRVDEQAKARAERDRQLKQLGQVGKSWKPSLRIAPIAARLSAFSVPGFEPAAEADAAEAADDGATEEPAVAGSRFSSKLLRQVVAAAKKLSKRSQSGGSTPPMPAAEVPNPGAWRFDRQLQRVDGVSVVQPAPSGPVAPRQLASEPGESARLSSRKYQAGKKRHQQARQKQSLLRAKAPEVTDELLSEYKRSVTGRVASSAEPVVTVVYFNGTFKAARALLSDMPNMRVLCVGILSVDLPLVVQTVKEFGGRLVYVRGPAKDIMSAKAILDCVDEAWGLGARNVVYLQAHPTCTTVSPAPLVQSAGHPHRGPGMEPLAAEAELDDKLRNGVMSLARELSVLCGPGFSAAVEQPAGIAEHVPSTVAILASSPWSKGYAPHCKLTPPGPKVKVSRKLSVYFLLNVHPFDIECKKDCGHMLPSMEYHRYMIAPTRAHRKKGAERLIGDDRVTVPRGLPYLMLGRQVQRFATGASRPAAAEVAEETGCAGDAVLEAEAFAAVVNKLPRYPRHTLTAAQLHQACGHVNDATLLRSVKLFNGFTLRRPDGKLIPGSKVVLADIQRAGVCHTCMTTKVTAAQSRQQKGRVLVESRLPVEAKEYIRERDGRVTRSMAQRVQQADALAASCSGGRPGVALAIP